MRIGKSVWKHETKLTSSAVNPCLIPVPLFKTTQNSTIPALQATLLNLSIVPNPRYGVDQNQCNQGVVAGVLQYSNSPVPGPNQDAMDAWCETGALNLTADGKKGCHAFTAFLFGPNGPQAGPVIQKVGSCAARM